MINYKFLFKTMRGLMFLFIVFSPILSNAQAYLGLTEKEIRNLHSDKTFEEGYTDDGEKYISAFMNYGDFFYYFDKKTKLSIFCVQVIYEIPYLNAQVEAYNKKYVIVSDTKWKAYLEGGLIMKINLNYDEEYKLYVFSYTN